MAGGEMMQTLSQQRAKKALELLSAIEERGENRTKFTQFCKSFPTMVLQNGLGQALAFIRAKGNGADGRKFVAMYNTLNTWLKDMRLIDRDVLQEIHAMSASKYVETQTESLRFLEWIKRYETAGIF
jgi:CRISPR-associated protein Cmr5